jgi:hypothetical protein
MKLELEKKLYKKYPKIFKQKDLSIQETCMCWGIEVGDGWYWLLDKLCASIQNYIDYSITRPPQVKAVQVKEKFGGLRFYVNSADNYVYGIIHFAESLSYHICESCGTTKNVSQNSSGWISTLCNKCRGGK